jgi:hypothetical protein
MQPKTIYCRGEAARFPVEEFRHLEDGTLAKPFIHETEIPHYVTGRAVRIGIGGFAELPGDPDTPPRRD